MQFKKQCIHFVQYLLKLLVDRVILIHCLCLCITIDFISFTFHFTNLNINWDFTRSPHSENYKFSSKRTHFYRRHSQYTLQSSMGSPFQFLLHQITANSLFKLYIKEYLSLHPTPYTFKFEFNCQIDILVS